MRRAPRMSDHPGVWVEPTRPSVRAAVPFVAVAVLILATTLLPPYDDGVARPLLLMGAFLVLVAFGAASTRRRPRSWVDPMSAFVFFLVVALARDLTGGAISELSPALILPILWLALTGSRRDLMVAGVLSAAVFLVPIVVVGGPDYPISDWRRALLWSAVSFLVAPLIQRMVQQLAQETRRAALSEARWRVLVDHLPDTTILMLDHELQIRLVTGSGAMRHKMEGYAGQRLADVSRPENMVVLGPMLDGAFAGKESTAELPATTTGAEHEVVVAPLPSEADGPRVLILARDVSRVRSRERTVVEARQRAERLFSDAPHGVAVLTTSGIVLQINTAMRTMVGEIPGGLEGQPLATLSGVGDGAVEQHVARALAETGLLVETDWTMRLPDGSPVHVALSSRVLPGQDGEDDLLLVNVVDVSERRRYEQRLAHLADHDALTGLANRRRFDEELQRHLEICQRYGPTGALLLLDLDHFKEVNDTLGHGAGDQLIISAGSLLRSGVRGTDIVARLGGDEFAILLVSADRAAAELVAQSIVDRIRDHTETLEGIRRRVTASIGVVTFRAASVHAEDALALADMTMYDAKDAGRNQYVVLDEDTSRPPRSGARLQWRGRIERALENDDFTLHLQPILDLRTNVIRSAEVLLRLQDTDELIRPARFLYIAERSGLIPAVDGWVIEHSLPMLASLRKIDPEFQLEVNLSGLSIGDAHIEEVIIESLREHRVPPSALILEITETAAVADVEVARQFAERMTDLGCKFALDDFGAGFGSFYYLKHLFFDYVKIDGEFVASCHRSSVDRTILRSIVGIAQDLGKQTVAEFVAELAILDVVRAEGVDFAQGYLVGKPAPYDEFVVRFLAAHHDPLPTS